MRPCVSACGSWEYSATTSYLRIGAGSGDNGTAGSSVGVPVRLRSITIAPPMISAAVNTEANRLDIQPLYNTKYLLSRDSPAFSGPERVTGKPEPIFRHVGQCTPFSIADGWLRSDPNGRSYRWGHWTLPLEVWSAAC